MSDKSEIVVKGILFKIRYGATRLSQVSHVLKRKNADGSKANTHPAKLIFELGHRAQHIAGLAS